VVITSFLVDDYTYRKVYFLRGNKKGKEVLIIDQDFNHSFRNDSTYILPVEYLDTDYPRDTNYIFPLDFGYNIELSYQSKCESKRITSLNLSVNIRYNSAQNKFYFLDNVSVGLGTSLVGKTKYEGKDIKIQMAAPLDWVDIHYFNISVDGKDSDDCNTPQKSDH
jgi:hypothetical protein